MKQLFSIFSLVITLFISAPSLAEEASPYKVIETVGNSLFERISNNQQEIAKFQNLCLILIINMLLIKF